MLKPLMGQGEVVADTAEQVGPGVVQVYRHRRGRPAPERGLGSGLIVDKQGHLLTNAHVVGGDGKVGITLADGRTTTAQVLATDHSLDLALLQLPTLEGLQPVAFAGNDTTVRPGTFVITVGNPYGLSWTVTLGVISAVNRSIATPHGGLHGLLQTDASINPGNSGGALATLDGRVVGIPTAMLAGGQGLGFAIPSSTARHAFAQLREHGRVLHTWLGVEVEDQHVDAELARLFELPATQGAGIARIIAGSPADRAGLRPLDVITAAGGRTVTSGGSLRHVLDEHQPGDELELTIVRGGVTRTVPVRLGERR